LNDFSLPLLGVAGGFFIFVPFVMDLEAVKNSFSQHPRIAELVNSISAGNTTRLHIKNLAGSSSAFAAATVVSQIPKTHVFILSGKEEAAYFLNDIEVMLGKEKVMFFSDVVSQTV
jgi:transcription-repair coupling factor (superfamily II helicase)